MAPKPKKTQRVDPYLSQAQLETDLQITPQVEALFALLSGERSNYINTRRVNASNARGISEAATQASMGVQAAYGGNAQAPAQGSLLAALAGSRGNPEGEAAYNRMAGEQARALSDFSRDTLTAEMSRQYSNNAAREKYLGAKDEITSSLQSLSTQSGKLTAATLGKLLEGRRERAADREQTKISASQSERNSIRSSGLDPDTNAPIPGGPLDVNDPRDQPNGPKKGSVTATGLKLASDESHQKATSYINEAVSHIKQLVEADPTNPPTRAELGMLLTQGAKSGEDGIPDIPKIPQPYVTAALDVALDGHLSRKTQTQLQQGTRLAVKRLGVPTYGEWRKRNGGVKAGVGGLSAAVDALLNRTS